MAYDVTKMTRLSHLKALAQRSEEKFATKKALAALQSTVDDIVSVGGQANVLEGVKVNGTALAIADKIVDILIATGSANGTLSVNGVDVSVKGLAALAYKANVSEADLDAALKAVIDAKAAKADLDAVSGKVTTLIGEDTGKSARTIANEELAKQLIAEGAKESLDTLAEIAAWIQAHPDDAAAMNEAITALQNKLAGIPEDKTVKAYVDEAITALNIGNYATTAWVGEQLANYYTKSEVDAELAKKVDKVEGYGLSKNDFSDDLKAKLDGIAVGATKVEASTTAGNIKVNGSEVSVVSIATDDEVAEMLAEVIPAVAE